MEERRQYAGKHRKLEYDTDKKVYLENRPCNFSENKSLRREMR